MFEKNSVLGWIVIPVMVMVVLLSLDHRAHPWIDPTLVLLTVIAGLSPVWDGLSRKLATPLAHRRQAEREMNALWERLNATPSTREDLKVDAFAQADRTS